MFFKTKSKIIAENTNDENLRKVFNKKFDSLNLGRRIECGIHAPWLREPIVTVQKGKETYHVCDASFFSVEGDGEEKKYSDARVFLVENNGNFEKMVFTSQAVQFFQDWHKKEHVEAEFNGEHIVLPSFTILSDVYDLRFQVRNNKKAKQFMDDFIIVDEDQRKHYKLYEIKRAYQEKKIRMLEKKVFRWDKSRGGRR